MARGDWCKMVEKQSKVVGFIGCFLARGLHQVGLQDSTRLVLEANDRLLPDTT